MLDERARRRPAPRLNGDDLYIEPAVASYMVSVTDLMRDSLGKPSCFNELWLLLICYRSLSFLAIMLIVPLTEHYAEPDIEVIKDMSCTFLSAFASPDSAFSAFT